MSKASPETELRYLRRELKATEDGRRALIQERDAFRARATKAEQDAAEWKRRFDLLLARTPEVPR